MALSLIAYPKIIYTQSAEPTNKTTGLLWYDTDDGKLYTADGSSYNVVSQITASYKLSDDLILSHDAEAHNSASTTPTKVKTITLSMFGTNTIRIGWEMKGVNSAADGRTRIYKNGIALGNIHSSISQSYTSFSEDLEFSGGDTLELWFWSQTGAATTMIKELRVYGKYEVDTQISGVNT